jgi:hypothetical protein
MMWQAWLPASRWMAHTPSHNDHRRRDALICCRCSLLAKRYHALPSPSTNATDKNSDDPMVEQPHEQLNKEIRLIPLNRATANWCWMALAVILECMPTVPGGIDSRMS